ncbi:hypothetical protein nbrc107696_24660 [Gordonia spumicola]|uniref:Bacterial Ig-like domain-containing protein n=1 Tax=Gordonia spumicola TaxID=589161 RepID=A0A7I9VAB8_9ACTN|nr:Ig-like domain-containing protein [Gordonia spumicola]GEE02020.1 hypothetical protein nbrc107696_24660 [Gordonia spumicola]
MNSTARKIIAVAGAGAGLISGLSAVPGSASAEVGAVDWWSGDSYYYRTVSDANPKIGDVITVTTQFQRRWSFEDIYNYKDIQDGCLTYVPGSAKWQNSTSSPAKNVTVDDAVAGSLGSVRFDSSGTTAWRVPGLGSGLGEKRTISVAYTVGADCPTGVNLATGTVHYGGSLGDGIWQGKGPAIKVQTPPQKVATTTSVSVTPAPKVGDPSTVTAKISSDSTVTDGTVEFFNHSTSIGTADVVNGKASVSWTPANEGAYSLKAVYSGTATLAGSSSSIGGTVTPKDPDPEPGAPIITLSNAPKLDQATTITIESDAAVGSAVALTANGTNLCSNLKLGSDHKVTCSWTPNASGAVALKAVIGSQSTTKNVTVAPKVTPTDPTTTDPTTTDPTTTNPGSGGNGSLDTGSLGGLFK